LKGHERATLEDVHALAEDVEACARSLKTKFGIKTEDGLDGYSIPCSVVAAVNEAGERLRSAERVLKALFKE
jgi:hypothetical protein